MEHILENMSLEKALSLSLQLHVDSDTHTNAGENYGSSKDKEGSFAAMQKTLAAT